MNEGTRTSQVIHRKASPADLASPTVFSKKLILVIEQDEQIGTQVIQLIRQATPFQAILACSLSEAHCILCHLRCDLFLLTDETFPEEDLERLYLLPEGIEPPALLGLTSLSCSAFGRGKRDAKRLLKAVNLLLSGHSAPPGFARLMGLSSDQANEMNALLDRLDYSCTQPDPWYRDGS